MRIIGGVFRGRRLKGPVGKDTRPSTDRVRESIFNLLYTRIDLTDCSVLDLFCGTGALGLEALSRGAAFATFVDVSPSTIALARENARALGVLDRCEFIAVTAEGYARRQVGKSFGVVFADPPYGMAEIESLAQVARTMLEPDGLLVLEHDTRNRFAEDNEAIVVSRSYGRTTVTIFEA